MSEHKSLLLLLFSSFRHVAFPSSSSSFCRNGYSSLGVPSLRAVVVEEEILLSSFPQRSLRPYFMQKSRQCLCNKGAQLSFFCFCLFCFWMENSKLRHYPKSSIFPVAQAFIISSIFWDIMLGRVKKFCSGGIHELRTFFRLKLAPSVLPPRSL